MKRCAGTRRSFALLLIVGFLALSPASAYAVELSVFAAASMTESMNRVAEEYRAIVPEVTIVYNFDSSGTLKTQIEQGADCDLFISAGQKQMNELDITADPAVNKEGLNFVREGTRFNIVSNRVVLIVPKGQNKRGIADFRDVTTDKVALVALGNSDVPVGQYSEEIYRNLGLWDQLKEMNRITYCSNVKEVLSQVAAGAVDCGIVYGTDAASAADKVDVVAQAPKGSHRPIVYPAGVMRATQKPVEAIAFAKYLQSPECVAIFERHGFSKPGE